MIDSAVHLKFYEFISGSLGKKISKSLFRGIRLFLMLGVIWKFSAQAAGIFMSIKLFF